MKRKYGKDHKEWRQKVLNRDEYRCVVCGNGPKFLNAHHIIPANFLKYRFEIDNGITLCPKCHTLGNFSAHKHPIWWIEWLKTNRKDAYELARSRLWS